MHWLARALGRAKQLEERYQSTWSLSDLDARVSYLEGIIPPRQQDISVSVEQLTYDEDHGA